MSQSTGFPVLDTILACIALDAHAEKDEWGACLTCGEHGEGPTNQWVCECGTVVMRFRGDSEVRCDGCDAEYNSGGQRLRDDWRGNMSNYDSEIGDMEGYEMQHAGDW